LFGFPDGTVTNNFSYINPLISIQSILMNKENSIFIRTDIPRHYMGAIENMNSENMFIESNILCCIPMTFDPFNTMKIDLSNRFVYYLSVKDLTKIRLYVTDENNNPIPFKYDWCIALLFEYLEIKEDNTIVVLNEVKTLLEDIRLLLTKK